MVKVTLLQSSISYVTGTPIYTFMLEYPRVAHAHVLTHRAFSKNSSSTRAVPVEVAIQQLIADPAQYIWTGKQKGMAGAHLDDPVILRAAQVNHNEAMYNAITSARMQDMLGIHKQNAGRYLEPFQNIRVVLTGTEFDNFTWLRDHTDTQPETAELARGIKDAIADAEPMMIYEGEYHVPFIDRHRNEGGSMVYTLDGDELTLEDALIISQSCCAQTSYRKLDKTMSKADNIAGMLQNGDRLHSSPYEHQATPIPDFDDPDGVTQTWPEGVTHMDRDYVYWSGNFKDFIQYRQLMPKHDPSKSWVNK